MSTETLKIAVLAGDGIGPEIMRETIKVLRAIEKKHRLLLQITEAPVGWDAIDKEGKALPDNTLALCKESDAILFGAVGLHYRDAEAPKEKRPERAALLRLRTEFDLYANFRPVKLPPDLAHLCPLRPERQGEGIDLLVVRETAGGLYHSFPQKTEEVIEVEPGGATAQRVMRAVDTMALTTSDIERIAHLAFRAAWLRRKKLASIDKANVLETSILWRHVVTSVGKAYPDVSVQHMLVDTAAMQLILRPAQFDVMLCENTFGDILGDEAAALLGSLGMSPTANLGKTHQGRTFGLYQPAGGTAPDIAGKNLANPIASIRSASMMFTFSFGMQKISKAIDAAVDKVIAEGYRTQDMCGPGETNPRKVSTTEMGDAIANAI